MARWYQRPRNGAHDSPRTIIAVNRITAAMTSRTATNSKGVTSFRPMRAVTKDVLHSRTKA
jgi:hypothetical protein